MLWKNLPKRWPWKSKLPALILLLVNSFWGQAQFVTKYELPGTRVQSITSNDPFTAVAIVMDKSMETAHDFIEVRIDGIRKKLWQDEHAPALTYFRSLATPGKSITLGLQSRGTIYLINSGVISGLGDLHKELMPECYEFEAVPQSTWRDGLPSPAFNRRANNVAHLIVHHTAGSNSNTNYTQVVRDIYLLHTDVNGWSDIGYNFLVAQDGSIFEGRDPGEELTEYDVLGAHFCGKNSGTMGVAMLGNFETAQPTDEAMESLSKVLASAAERFELNVLENSRHRGQDLAHLSGHRDGCATLCPGEHLYPRLDSLKLEVVDLLDGCEEPPGPHLAFNVYPNPIMGDAELLQVQSPDSVISYQLTHINGQHFQLTFEQYTELQLGGVEKGIYILSATTKNDVYRERIVVR